MQWDTLGYITVLIVDDDAFNRQLIISLLSKIPTIDYIEAQNGIEALEILASNNIDIILLDLHMPKLNGIDTIKEIKKNIIDSLIPIIIITTDEMIAKEVYELGADDFLSKPFKLNNLAQKIYKQISSSAKDKDIEIVSYLVEAFLEILHYIKEDNDTNFDKQHIVHLIETFNILLSQKNSKEDVYHFFEKESKKLFDHKLICYFLDYFDYFVEMRDKYINLKL
ncbi:MAG: response regulator [Epsilonproteobacteria bacterium]|nr:response regulator [Campylobacterota bacterium]